MQILLRRIFIATPTLLLLSLAVFLLLELTPGDAASAVLDQATTAEQEEQLREELGLNRSLAQRYLDYLGGLLRGDMGNSARSGLPVVDEISLRLPYTLALIGASIALGALIGVTVGAIGAFNHGKPVDMFVTGVISIGTAIPIFWLALLLVNLFALQLRWLPVFGADSPKHMILPALCTSFTLVPGIARLTRASLLETFGADFILVARSKGLHNSYILGRHISPLAAISIVTFMGIQTVRLISSVAVMETIFNWPGLGGLAIRAAFDRDPLLLQGTTLTIALMTFAILFLVDLMIVYLDPRIKAV